MIEFSQDDIGAIIAALYRTLLHREPDAAGLAGHIARFIREKGTLDQLIGDFLRSAEFQDKLPQFLRQLALPVPLINDASQNGEVGALIRHMVNAAASRRFVVDVGARGRARSNSYDLLNSFGWSGLLIEANPALIPGLRADFAGLSCAIVNCAISDFVGEASFHLGVNDDVSSLDHQLAENWGPTQGAVTVRVERLPDLLARQDVAHDFDLLSLDIEGHDIRVLNDLIANSAYRPRWILIEVPPVEVNHLADLPFDSAVLANYEMLERIGPNLLLRQA